MAFIPLIWRFRTHTPRPPRFWVTKTLHTYAVTHYQKNLHKDQQDGIIYTLNN